MITETIETIRCKCGAVSAVTVFHKRGGERVGHLVAGDAVGWGYRSDRPCEGLCPSCRAELKSLEGR